MTLQNGGRIDPQVAAETLHSLCLENKFLTEKQEESRTSDAVNNSKQGFLFVNPGIMTVAVEMTAQWHKKCKVAANTLQYSNNIAAAAVNGVYAYDDDDAAVDKCD